MKAFLKSLAVLILGLSALAPASAVRAGGGGSFSFRGPSVVAEFYYPDASGCIYTDLVVSGSQATVRDVPGPADNLSFASVNLLQYDACSNTALLSAWGSVNPLAGGDLLISNRLSSASLNTTVNLFDEISASNFDVDLDLAWASTGPISRQRNRMNDNYPGCHMIQHWSGTSRPAAASGSVSARGTNFAAGASQYASIDLVRAGNILIGCGESQLTSSSGGFSSTTMNLRGPTANASFSTADPSGCINTDVFVSASGGIEQDLPGRGTPIHVASVSIYKYDSCNDVELLNAGGLTESLPAGDFQVSKQLDWATLTATVNVDDLVSGTSFPVDVDVSWTGTGSITRSRSHTNDIFPGCHIINRWQGSGRTAAASGTVSDGVTNFTPTTSQDAEIVFARAGFEIMGCP